jgi:hypothetical protein
MTVFPPVSHPSTQIIRRTRFTKATLTTLSIPCPPSLTITNIPTRTTRLLISATSLPAPTQPST